MLQFWEAILSTNVCQNQNVISQKLNTRTGIRLIRIVKFLSGNAISVIHFEKKKHKNLFHRSNICAVKFDRVLNLKEKR